MSIPETDTPEALKDDSTLVDTTPPESNVEGAQETETPSIEEQEAAAIDEALAAAAAEDGLPPADPAEVPDVDKDEKPGDKPADDDAVKELTPEEQKAADEKALTDQDEKDAKDLGFKNQKATTEFKAMRSELRELRPLKEQIAEYEAPAQRWGELNTYFEEKQITPDQFGQAMLVTAAFNSTSLDAKREARNVLLENAKLLSEQIGDEGAGYDPLTATENHDLQEKVESGEIGRSDALELAKARKLQAHTQQLTQREQDQKAQSTAIEGARAEAISELNTMGEQYKKLDPLYETKLSMIQGPLRSVFTRLHPSQWAEQFAEAYDAVVVPAGTPAPAARPAPLRTQPLRPTGSSSGMQQGIKTEEDAIEAALRDAAIKDGVVYKG